ncbi:MAG: hypothetical protein H0U63_04585 [Burkholderiales bacterium]|nr:hypothetical protein [Burkholderiales bacterium]
MARGGKRDGSGRKLGSLTKRTRAIAEQAATEGKAPLEVMLDNMRHFQQVALDAEAVLAGLTAEEIGGKDLSPEDQFKMLLAKAKNAAGFRQMAQECARDAAAYMHPKLTAIEHTGAKGGPILIRASKEQRDAAVSAALRVDTDA